ncbi:hypothetical protein B0H14DRAFT_2363802, partial [Mycena olivaceomarginata]
YQEWAKKNNFESRLPDDPLRPAIAAKVRLRQQSLDPHLRKKPDRLAPYTDDLFMEAALEWLIATDQANSPVDALTHPKFKIMIDIAARATIWRPKS